MIKKYFIFILAIITLLITGLGVKNITQAASGTGTATMTLVPGTSTIAAGSSASIQVKFNTGTLQAFGFQIVADFTGSVPANIVFNPVPPPNFSTSFNQFVNITGGKQLQLIIDTGGSVGYSTNGSEVVLGTLTFTAPTSGNMVVTFNQPQTVILNSSYVDFLYTVTNATYTFGTTTSPSPSPSASPSPSPSASPTLTVTLTAAPTIGTAPLNNVDLTADVGGTATGNITYNFDCTNNGTSELTVTNTQDPYTALDLCDYAAAGTYTAKVTVTRSSVTTQATRTITVSPPVSPSPSPSSSPPVSPSPSPSPSTPPGTASLIFNIRFEGVSSNLGNRDIKVIAKTPNTIELSRNVNLTHGSSGIYSNSGDPLIDLPTGNYTFYLNGPVHLTRRFTKSLVAGANTVSWTADNQILLAGDSIDLRSDNQIPTTADLIDIFDYNKIVEVFNCRVGSPPPPGKTIAICSGLAEADYDFDTDVDIFDYNFLVGNFNKTGEIN